MGSGTCAGLWRLLPQQGDSNWYEPFPYAALRLASELSDGTFPRHRVVGCCLRGGGRHPDSQKGRGGSPKHVRSRSRCHWHTSGWASHPAPPSRLFLWSNHQSRGTLCASRPGERRGSAGLLGPGPGHPHLQWVPERVLPSPLHPPLPRLRPGRMRWLLAGASGRAITRMGPPGEGLQQLQGESRGALAAGAESKRLRIKGFRFQLGFPAWHNTVPSLRANPRHDARLSLCEQCAWLWPEHQGGSCIKANIYHAYLLRSGKALNTP